MKFLGIPVGYIVWFVFLTMCSTKNNDWIGDLVKFAIIVFLGVIFKLIIDDFKNKKK